MAKTKIPKDIKVELPKAEEPVKARGIPEIQQEFTNLCAKAGHLQYQVFTYSRDLETLNNQMRDLNFEAAALNAKEAQNKENTNE